MQEEERLTAASYRSRMRVFDMLVDERRHMAELLETLTEDQWRQPSLCVGWAVHDVAAHLTTYLRFGQAKLYLGVLLTAGDIDRINLFLTRRAAGRSIARSSSGSDVEPPPVPPFPGPDTTRC